jgi:ankyrin repeat protein
MDACQHGQDAAVIKLLERDDIQVNLQDKYGWTALMSACFGEHENIVKILVQRRDIRVNLQELGINGETALMYACKKGHEGIVKLLREREDIDIRLRDKKGRTAYDHCSIKITEDVKKRLLV